MKDVQKLLTEIVCEQLGVDESQIKPEANFTDDLGADSLDKVELLMAVEEEFGIEISDEDGEKLITFGEAKDYIEKRLGQN